MNAYSTIQYQTSLRTSISDSEKFQLQCSLAPASSRYLKANATQAVLIVYFSSCDTDTFIYQYHKSCQSKNKNGCWVFQSGKSYTFGYSRISTGISESDTILMLLWARSLCWPQREERALIPHSSPRLSEKLKYYNSDKNCTTKIGTILCRMGNNIWP